MNKQFSEEEIQIANKYMKQCSEPSAMKEMQIKTTLGFHLTPVRLHIRENRQHMLVRIW
jgi:hypothetical protein